ncbi:hypothetical protein AB0C12_28230 [Actinoplanes sp. NPDC048967]|uniref:hypothetical protein n=1 Tax=Actinoplanes sp. NPDC048967 TaxID=3155269 RepID=UPI0033EDADC5
MPSRGIGQLAGADPEELGELAERIAAAGVPDPRAGGPALLAGLAGGVHRRDGGGRTHPAVMCVVSPGTAGLCG